VLVEGDDMNEPIADAARSILDGHLVLSRRLATSGHFPSIEVLDSISRVESVITTREQRGLVRELRRLLASYRDTRDLIEIGAYSKGANALVDRAIDLREPMDDFLCQDIAETCTLADSWGRLAALLAPAPAAATAAPPAGRGAVVVRPGGAS
jgi:flagellum-specific ATP synthase